MLNMSKINLFEYVVYQLDNWYMETNNGNHMHITKLRLQKILFLLSAVNATKSKKGLLSIFNRFYALSMGPVEMDIYDAMNHNLFTHIRFVENECVFEPLERNMFSAINARYLTLVDEAIAALKTKNRNYLTMPIYELVELTHQWSVWQIASSVAELQGKKCEEMPTDEICTSLVKSY